MPNTCMIITKIVAKLLHFLLFALDLPPNGVHFVLELQMFLAQVVVLCLLHFQLQIVSELLCHLQVYAIMWGPRAEFP